MSRKSDFFCSLAAASLVACGSRTLMPAAAPDQGDVALESRRRVVQFIRAAKRLREPLVEINPKDWLWDPDPPALPERIGCLASPLDLPEGDLFVSSVFRDPNHAFDLFKGYHSGIDLPVPVGTEIHAPAAGTVTRAYDERVEDSWQVTVDMGDGWRFRAVHLSRLLVEVGDAVRQGEVIGLSGGAVDDFGSGPYTTGPHLHFDVAHLGQFVDPRPHFCEQPLKSP